MLDQPTQFPSTNPAYDRVFRPGRLSLGLVLPLDAYSHSAVPALERHLERAELAEALGFSALWLRDVPFNVPSFGDAGQVFDPFVYLGLLAGRTRRIGLGVASLILPLRHPAHVAKAAASVDVLSQGRLLLGVASGDRPDEYPALGQSHMDRGARFRDSIRYIRSMAEDYPSLTTDQGRVEGQMDMLPKPFGRRIPLLITGGSQQSPDWLAENGDGWITYPRPIPAQAQVVGAYRAGSAAAGRGSLPVMQSLYVDLVDQADAPPQPIHLGFRSGIDFLRRYLTQLQELGVNHVALNLRFTSGQIEPTLQSLADHVLPAFDT